jgi:hypothetical protein
VLFLAADKQARRQVIEEAERLAALSGRMRTLRIAPDDLVVPLETAAMGRDDEAFVSILSLALERIGHKSHALYDGSWAEWGMYDDLSVEKGPAR